MSIETLPKSRSQTSALAGKHREPVDAVVVGVGLPGRSVGWLHLTQLLAMEAVRVRHVVEPWWIEAAPALDGARTFSAARQALKVQHPEITFHASVATLPPLGRDRPCLAVIAARTANQLTFFKALVEKGVTHVYLEKPGARGGAELQEMITLAERLGVAVVVGYQKTVSGYVQRAFEADRRLANHVVTLTFEHHNPHRPEDLAAVFSANPEGMLLNQCCHELALWVTRWGLTPRDILDVVVLRHKTSVATHDGVQDFVDLAFTVTTTFGRNFALVASRCGGTESSITVQANSSPEKEVFPEASPEQHEQARRYLTEHPNTAWYQPLFSRDYLSLKLVLIDHIQAGRHGVPPGVPTLADAAAVFELADCLLPSLRAQTPLQLQSKEAAPLPKERRILFATRDDCRTPTYQRIWYAPALFDPSCSLLVDLLRPPRDQLVLCIDDGVWSLYREALEVWADAQSVQLSVIVVPGGERAKNIDSWKRIIENLWAVNPLRHTEPILAMGGGSVTDMVGFAASVWRRSTPWVRIPTTLLGMVDASVGVKVSVNFLIKNGIGDFHSPRHTFIDPTFLRTNLDRELKSAVGEIAKAGLIYDRRIYDLLREEGPRLIREKFSGDNGLPCESATRIITLSIEAMLACIGPDLYEENLSRQMDFGHTFSRWLERHERFSLRHGEAVAIDSVFSCLIAEQKGWLTPAEANEILCLYQDLGMVVHVRGLTPEVYREAIEQTIVHRSGVLRAPLPGPIGHCRWASEITSDELGGAWQRLQTYLSSYPEGVFDPNQDKHDPKDTLYYATDGFSIKPQDALPPVQKPVRWGVLGCGLIANDFALTLKAVPNALIAAVAARDGERAKRFAEQHGVGTWNGNYRTLVEDPNLDVIYIATIPELHRAHAELALAAGKHVLIEKPLATTPEDAEAIRQAAQKAGRFCMEGMWMRFFPAVELARKTVRAGEIGEVLHVRADFGFDLIDDEGVESTKWASGAGMNAGVYPAHAAVMVLGADLFRVAGVGTLDSLGYGMDAEGLLYATFDKGRTATVTWSHIATTPEEVDVIGTEGSIRLHSPAHCPTRVTITRKQGGRREGRHTSITREFPLPIIEGKFFYPNSEGLYYQAMAVQRCLQSGLTACPQAPLAESVQVIHMIHRAVRDICDRNRNK